MDIKSILRCLLGWWTRPIRVKIYSLINDFSYKKNIEEFFQQFENTKGMKHIFYLGITEHSNLGDFAQYYCIDKWIKSYCPEYELLEIGANSIINKKFHFFEKLSQLITKDDVIVFQSGYTTQDLGGFHDEMHRRVADAMPDAKILMMPQTIFFREEKNKLRTATSLNKCKNMLFLARDFVSFKMAKQMFPNIHTMAYPDIVTSLIGNLVFDNERNKIFLCRRNDGEKFYPEYELIKLKERLSQIMPVDMGDTQSTSSYKELRKDPRKFIEAEIEKYSHYKVTITDRYHGTIFSLCAGTPVIILKTTDHKVTTGADWFDGVYDGYVQVSTSLEDAYNKAQTVIGKNLSSQLPPYFEKKYYGKALRVLFDEMFKKEEF